MPSHPLESAPPTTVGLGDLVRERRQLRGLLEENRRLQRELAELREFERLAHSDPLTGLPNRRLFEQRLQEELSRAARDPRYVGSLLVLDLNDLKVVNDTFGHDAGDRGLRAIAESVRGSLRTPDVCCRTGGDEFMVLLPDTDARGAARVMARLRIEAIRAGARLNLPLSMSVGGASWPDDGVSAEVLLDSADRAMYLEKRKLQARSGRPRPPRGSLPSLVKKRSA